MCVADERHGRGPQKWHTVEEPDWSEIRKAGLEQLGVDVKERIAIGKKEMKYGCCEKLRNGKNGRGEGIR